jgi:ribosomal-protein-alanine N-acetyltransferase
MNASKISLRALKAEDINETYCSWYENNDGHLNYFTGSGRKFDRDVLINDFNEGLKTGRWFYYLIQTHEDEPIGNVKIGPIDFKNKTSDLVCLIGNRKFLGKGLATEAIKLANDIAFTQHDIRRLQSGMFASNIASIKAYTRADWVIEGTFAGYYLFNDQPEDRVCVACFNPKYF